MNTVELASRILTQLGFYQEPSKELGVDDRRDRIVYLIEEYTHPVEEQDESFDRTASHMAGEYVAYKAELTDEEITDCLIEWAKVEHADEYSDPTAEELAPIIRMIRAILKKAQE